MMKGLVVVFGLGLMVALGYGGYLLFDRYGNATGQVERMITTMSQMETARVSFVLRRASVMEGASFVFGDLRVSGVVDARASSLSYDLKFDAAPVSGVSEERTVLLARRLPEATYLQVAEAPRVLMDVLKPSGVEFGVWNQVNGTADVFTLLGETAVWPVEMSENVARLRERIAAGEWFVRPKATLTEIVHGRVTRIVTAELDASVPAWEGARVNLWIDQKNDELRRMVIQRSNGDTLDIEFEEMNGEVLIEEPREEGLPSAGDQEDVRGNPLPVTANQAIGESSNSDQSFPTTGDADGDGLTDDLEGFYGSDPRNPDSDGDGYTDGEEVKNGYSPTGNGSLFNFGLPTL